MPLMGEIDITDDYVVPGERTALPAANTWFSQLYPFNGMRRILQLPCFLLHMYVDLLVLQLTTRLRFDYPFQRDVILLIVFVTILDFIGLNEIACDLSQANDIRSFRLLCCQAGMRHCKEPNSRKVSGRCGTVTVKGIF